MKRPASLALALIAACTNDSTARDAAHTGDLAHDTQPDSGDSTDTSPTPVEGPALGLNDLTFLLPPETFPTPLVPPELLLDEALFNELVTDSGDVITEYARLVPVAVRFDLCDRIVPGPCPTDADASLRIVLQPLSPPRPDTQRPDFEDVAVHAFYPIPRAELPALVAQLRELAELGQIPASTPLRPNPALAATPDGPYRTKLAQLVMDHAAPNRLIRLTALAQFSIRAALVWLFRGVERSTLDEPLARIVIPDVDAEQQDVLLVGRNSYEVTPVADAPAGLELALDEFAFDAATSTRRQEALDALAQIDSPAAHTAHTTQCANCHVTTQLALHRGGSPAADIGPFSPRPFDPESAMDRSLRALGYVFSAPVVSQRAANETAAVAVELEGRFPSTRPAR